MMTSESRRIPLSGSGGGGPYLDAAASRTLGCRPRRSGRAIGRRYPSRWPRAQDIDRVAQETRRTGVIVEGLRSDFRVATEGFTAVNRRLDVVEAQASRTEQRVDVLESRVGAVEAPRSRRRRPRSS